MSVRGVSVIDLDRARKQRRKQLRENSDAHSQFEAKLEQQQGLKKNSARMAKNMQARRRATALGTLDRPAASESKHRRGRTIAHPDRTPLSGEIQHSYLTKFGKSIWMDINGGGPALKGCEGALEFCLPDENEGPGKSRLAVLPDKETLAARLDHKYRLRQCASCHHFFDICSLRKKVTRQSINRLKERWAKHGIQRSSGSGPPFVHFSTAEARRPVYRPYPAELERKYVFSRLYDLVGVCCFCAQFFEESIHQGKPETAERLNASAIADKTVSELRASSTLCSSIIVTTTSINVGRKTVASHYQQQENGLHALLFAPKARQMLALTFGSSDIRIVRSVALCSHMYFLALIQWSHCCAVGALLVALYPAGPGLSAQRFHRH